MIGDGPLVLASASPRRRLLLEEAGIAVRVHPPDIDDGQLQNGAVAAHEWVMALAHLKARRVLEMLGSGEHRCLLGADTLCVHRSRILGQPRDEDHARHMLRAMRNDAHRTITGVCLLNAAVDDAGSPRQRYERLLFFDSSEVRLGMLDDAQIDQYIASGTWRGKAGAYNLAERLAAGWPIQCTGDPATVMGLPMRRLAPMLQQTSMRAVS